MLRLSCPIEELRSRYTVVIVGSGYGAAIAASRLARAGQQVCVLERGKEFQSSEYPNTASQVLEEMQADTPDGHIGSRDGLYEFNINDGVNVFKGCGLGGSSLVNANVSLRPEPRIFEDPRWPEGLRRNVDTLLEQGFRRAEEMLRPNPYPVDGFPPLPKLEALELSARSLEAKFYRAPINVNFTVNGKNHVGVEQRPCVCCGDCVTGCNYAAKNTLTTNYLPDAKNYGAEIYTQVDVRWLGRSGDRWEVYYRPLGQGRDVFNGPDLRISADVVVLGAGALGSTEILLRSKARGLNISDQVGERFTSNGDVQGFAYNTDRVINGVGWGHHQPGEIPPVGPCITGVIDLRSQSALADGIVIEEGSPPGPLAAFLPAGLAAAASIGGRQGQPGLGDKVRAAERQIAGWLEGPYHGAVRNTQTLLLMTHDDAAGQMTIDDERLRIQWPGAGRQPIFDKANATLSKASEPLGGQYVIDPVWSRLLHNNLLTVHPLGGCAMAEHAETGVVNHKCQVFSSARGASVYQDLYVVDGAVMPMPLGVNPLLTISALAERAVAIAAQERGWVIDYTLPSVPAESTAPQRVGVKFTEKMAGYFSSKVRDDYQHGADQGKLDNSRLSFILTVVSEDVENMIQDPAHQARMIGSVEAPALSPQSLMVNEGIFKLFEVDPQDPSTRRMGYRMTMRSAEDRPYHFVGFKLIRHHPAYDAWHDATTLYVTLHDGPSEESPVFAKGILVIQPQDFLEQLTTINITNAPSIEQRLAEEGKFARFFLGVLAEKYGTIFRMPTEV